MKNIVIIGAGLGGLTAGALLAKEGYSVTILEQHNIVGGCATTFKRKGGFICEVGLHEMDGVYINPQIKDIFNKLDVYKNVEFVKPKELFSITTANGKFIMPDGLNEAKEKLINKFSKDKEGIEKYFKAIEAIYYELQRLQSAKWYDYILFPLYFKSLLKYKDKSVTEVLNSIIDNEELKLILNANVQYYNDTPDTLSFLLHSVAQYSYYLGGGWFIKGGSQTLSNYLASVVKENGGEIITKADVITCSKNSVTYKKGANSVIKEYDIVVSNLSPTSTYKLFNKEYQEKKEIADSLLTVYIGFSKNLKSVYGEREYSNFIFDNIASVSEYNIMLKKSIQERGFVFVDYSQVDSKLTKSDKKSFGVACYVDKIDNWESLDKEEYKIKKDNLAKKVLEKLEHYYPDISSLVEYIEVGTSKTVKRYIKTPKGTAYGYKPTPKQFFKVPSVKSKKVDNLYFVGQWVISGGFSPTILSGKLCFDKING